MSDAQPDLNYLRTLSLPRHVAIIMDGNGRWAEKRNKPRFTGHHAGVETVREIIEMSGKLGIEVVTLFTFSSENWRRPQKEVGMLMDLFMRALEREVKKLHKNNIQLRVIGDKSAFPEKLQKRIHDAEQLTVDNTGMVVVIAANYGGKWDVTQAVQKLTTKLVNGEISAEDIDQTAIEQELCLSDLPEPDLFIRSGGEERISNFLIWQLAYTELFFTQTLWPDFNASAYAEALESFAHRQRRFGQTGAQIAQQSNA